MCVLPECIAHAHEAAVASWRRWPPQVLVAYNLCAYCDPRGRYPGHPRRAHLGEHEPRLQPDAEQSGDGFAARPATRPALPLARPIASRRPIAHSSGRALMGVIFIAYNAPGALGLLAA